MSLIQNEPRPLQLQDRNGNSITVHIRDDGYVNATKLCQDMGKRWSGYWQTVTAKEFARVLSGIESTKVLEADELPRSTRCLVYQSNSKVAQTWVHPDIAINLAQWAHSMPPHIKPPKRRKTRPPPPTKRPRLPSQSPVEIPELIRTIIALVPFRSRGRVRLVNRTWNEMTTFTPDEYNTILDRAVYRGKLAVVDRLLRDDRVNGYALQKAVRLAAYEGHLAILDRLLQDPRADPTTEDDCDAQALQIACCENHPDIVDRLLHDPRVDPNLPQHNSALYIASVEGHLQVVQRLLREPLHLDTVHDAWVEASKFGQEEVGNILFDYLEVNNYDFSTATLRADG